MLQARRSTRSLIVIALLAGALASATLETALGRAPTTTAFTYQGQLKNAGAPASGTYEFQFSLWDAATGGTQVGATLSPDPVTVTSGLFTVPVNFGQRFDSTRLWLQIDVRPLGGGAYTPLADRQELTSAPYANGLTLPVVESTPSDTGLSITSTASNGTGIYGTCDTGLGAWGVAGFSAQGTGVSGSGGHIGGEFTGGYFSATAAGVSGTGQIGVKGLSEHAGALGLYGSYGGYFQSTASGGIGLYAEGSTDSTCAGIVVKGGAVGIEASSPVVAGRFISTGTGLYVSGDDFGINASSNSANSDLAAIQGANASIGVRGFSSRPSTSGSLGTNFSIGVDGTSVTGSTVGSFGGRFISTVSGANGVYGQATGAGGYGVWGKGLNSALAANFDGPVKVNGALTIVGSYTATGSKSFKIDHPLNPTGAYLQHSCIESSEMLNLYTGNARLDGAGRAVVQLPNWFTAENTDYRYQLTSIGAPGSGLYVAREIDHTGVFLIAGGTPGGKVSWQVSAVRNDVYARAANFQVEVAKTGDEVGRYLDPRVYGLDQSLAIGGHKTPPSTPVMPAALPQ